MTTTNTLWKKKIFVIPRSKKNSQIIAKRGNRSFIVQSKQYREYEKECLRLIEQPEKPIDEPVNVQMRFYMPTRRKCDLVNMEQAILDILVRAKVLADDNYSIVYSMDGSRVFYDKESPRVEIEISRP